MALVNKINKIQKSSRVHGEVNATYNLLTRGGQKYIQINTYGSSNREVQGAVSQTIQLSEDVINQLQEILRSEF